MATLYEVLGVAEQALQAEIKDAYRQQAMKWHPDRNLDNRPQAEEKFKEIGLAYRTLSDPAQRQEYDVWLHSQRNQSSQQSYSNDAGMSGDDAERMFFENMLDLAKEIAARGYDAETIAAALVALECPEGVAKVVAENAVKQRNRASDSDNTQNQKQQRDPATKFNSIESMSWDDAAPYYAAVIGGVHADERMDEDEFQEHLNLSDKQIIGYWICFVTILLAGAFSWVLAATTKGRSLPTIFSFGVVVIGLAGFIGIAIWRMVTSDVLFRRERAMRYYLNAFRSFHEARPNPEKLGNLNFQGGIFYLIWLPYRRMTGYALVAILAAALIGSFQIILEVTYPEFVLVSRISYYGIVAVLIVFANRLYFQNSRKKVKRHFELPRDQALVRLRNVGGVNSWSWMLSMLLLSTLSMPAYFMAEDKKQERAAEQQRVIDEQRRAEAQAQADAQAAAAALERRKYDTLVSELETRYPEINPDSPRYDQRITDNLLARYRKKMQKGQSPSDALQAAMNDMIREAAAAQPHNTN